MTQQTASMVSVAAGLFIGLFVAAQLSFADDKQAEPKTFKTTSNFNNPELKYAPPPMPATMSFAGEKVPLERWDVKERFDRELLFNYYNKANILYLLKLSNRYFPIIEKRLKVQGIPDDFKYLAVAESNLMGGARSSAGAVGYWQFMNGTAPAYGLQANSQVDDRYDIIKSTDAAAKYLKKAYDRFGSWTAAAASYNCGMGGYNGHANYQGTKHYYDLLLPEETNRYIFRILTFKHLLENAEELGFELNDAEAYNQIPYKTVTVNSSISNLSEFARSHGTTYKMLKQMNPWLRGKSLTVKNGQQYSVKLPGK